MHACRCRAIDTSTHIYPHVRACTRVWLQTNADGAADARACAHWGIRTCKWMNKRRYRRTFVHGHTTLVRGHAHVDMRTCALSHGIYMHTHTHTCTHTYIRRCMGCARVPLSTRAHTRAQTHTHLHGIYTYTHMHILDSTHIRTHMVTHI